MVTPEQGTAAALDLARQAAKLLDGVGDRAGAMRLRQAAAMIRHDAGFPARDAVKVPLSLMKMALALFDRDGHRTSDAAIHLQAAIDRARGARPLGPRDEIDPDLIAAFLSELPAQPPN
ncbi:hypothetical protein D9601_17110 [Sphingomonas sp. MA1305]|jgi:hypothetical protein|uniref:hypothetical protein n=1 Tax=Sphingomonas sp. MA1305 TaxID=2479204 RepID=UPI0018DFB894|nr:hypothetical protein [Sphingomonas sp. MA1305]MBI0477070.1 hypothetical protein [Sphingomonas sp. MA1305]